MPARVAQIGFVSHVLPSGAPADRPDWVRFAQSARRGRSRSPAIPGEELGIASPGKAATFRFPGDEGRKKPEEDKRAAKNERRRKNGILLGRLLSLSSPFFRLLAFLSANEALLAAGGHVATSMSLWSYHFTIRRRFSTPAC
jgi:hypothetical protein